MKKPKKWTEVYPQGTKDGDEEAKFFKSLARNPKFEWRSVGQMVKESGLERKRVEEIIQKYLKQGLVIASKSKEDHYAYWERVPELLKDDKSLTAKDQQNRIDNAVDDTMCSKTYTGFPDEFVSRKDILTRYGKKSGDKNQVVIEGKRDLLNAINKEKMKKLEALKLEVMANNPVGLMVQVDEQGKPINKMEAIQEDMIGITCPITGIIHYITKLKYDDMENKPAAHLVSYHPAGLPKPIFQSDIVKFKGKFQEADKLNINKRIYPKEVLEKSVEKWEVTFDFNSKEEFKGGLQLPSVQGSWVLEDEDNV